MEFNFWLNFVIEILLSQIGRNLAMKPCRQNKSSYYKEL